MPDPEATHPYRRARRAGKEFPDGSIRSKLSLWLDARVHQHLVRQAVELNTSQQQILLEALDLWLRKYKQPSIADLVQKPSPTEK